MSLFGAAIGNDLNLLSTRPERLKALSGQAHCDFHEQLRHQCIRRAWVLSVASRKPVRPLLDLIVGRAALAYADACGRALSERFMDMEMEHARRENEWWSCFGFFVEERAQEIFLDSTLDAGQNIFEIKLQRLEVLREQLERYRVGVRTNALARETVQIVQRATGLDPNLQECRRLDAVIDLVRLGIEVVAAEAGSNPAPEPPARDEPASGARQH